MTMSETIGSFAQDLSLIVMAGGPYSRQVKTIDIINIG